MLAFPNCKINIGLYITSKRPDGYHDLETVFYPLGLKDSLEIIESKETTLSISGQHVGGKQEDNIIWKAWQLMDGRFPGKIPAVDIYLLKAIPMGAGLGGGSADGAFMLKLLDEMARLGLTEEQLMGLALELGSDCPFFIRNTPQYATGRGEEMAPLELDLSGFSIQLISPELHISTADAFREIRPAPAAFNLRELGSLPVVAWKDAVSNDFEKTVFQKHPELKDIKRQLYNQGAVYASMTGTGSALYGIFHQKQKAVISSTLPIKEHYVV